jgi:hypothetical protein
VERQGPAVAPLQGDRQPFLGALVGALLHLQAEQGLPGRLQLPRGGPLQHGAVPGLGLGGLQLQERLEA